MQRIKLKSRVKQRLARLGDDVRAARLYRNSLLSLETLGRTENTVACVVVHLYYIESWNLFSEKLKELRSIAYDLYVTMPEKNRDFEPRIRQDFSDARIVYVPNRGRDVLSFMELKDVLLKKGYQYALKIHSKKSTHRTDGEDWLRDMVEALLPSSTELQEQLRSALDNKQTGVVGPEGQYLSLVVNFDANSRHIMAILDSMYPGREMGTKIERARNDYGFFAGTMFWARLDALVGISHIQLSRYELERGQIDGTLPHALERLFSLVPEIDGKDVYEIGATLKKVPYKTTNIPDWSDVYIGSKD